MYNDTLGHRILEKLDEAFPRKLHLHELRAALPEYGSLPPHEWLLAVEALKVEGKLDGKFLQDGRRSLTRQRSSSPHSDGSTCADLRAANRRSRTIGGLTIKRSHSEPLTRPGKFFRRRANPSKGRCRRGKERQSPRASAPGRDSRMPRRVHCAGEKAARLGVGWGNRIHDS